MDINSSSNLSSDSAFESAAANAAAVAAAAAAAAEAAVFASLLFLPALEDAAAAGAMRRLNSESVSNWCCSCRVILAPLHSALYVVSLARFCSAIPVADSSTISWIFVIDSLFDCWVFVTRP